MKIALTDNEVLAEIRSDSLRNRVRKILSASAGRRIEQAYTQRRMPSPVEIRRMELEAAEEIIELVTSDIERQEIEQEQWEHDRLFEEDGDRE